MEKRRPAPRPVLRPAPSAVAAAPDHAVAPPPAGLARCAQQFLDCAARRGSTAPAALAELEAILTDASLLAASGQYYAGWAAAASYAVQLLAPHLDPGDARHLPLLLAHTDCRARVARLHLSGAVQPAPRLATAERPYPLEPVGESRAAAPRRQLAPLAPAQLVLPPEPPC